MDEFPLSAHEMRSALPEARQLAECARNVFTITAGIDFEPTRKYAALAVRLTAPKAESMALGGDILMMLVPPASRMGPDVAMRRVLAYTKRHRVLDERVAFVMADFSREDVRHLKKLGRQHHVQIIFVRYTYGLTLGPTEFERELSLEWAASDPFDHALPVSDDAEFFGRRDEVIVMARQLQRGRVTSMFGIRRAGKTSVLDRIQRIGSGQGSFISALIDFEKAGIATLQSEELFEAMAGALVEAADGSFDGYATATSRSRNSYLSEDDFWHHLRLRGKPAVLLIDEIDRIVPDRANSDGERRFQELWRSLRSLYQESARQGCVLSLVVAGVSSYFLDVAVVGGEENAARRLVPAQFLPPFQRAASIAMIQVLGDRCGLVFSSAADWARQPSYFAARLTCASNTLSERFTSHT